MAWRSIGEGEGGIDTSAMRLQPFHRVPPPVFPTYQVVMGALKDILGPINEALDPEHKMRMQQLRDYNSPQAQQMRQREQALRGREIAMKERLLPSQERVAMANADLTDVKVTATKDALKGGGRTIIGGIPYVYNPISQQLERVPQSALDSESANATLDALKARSKQNPVRPAQAPQAPNIPVPLQGANIVTPTPGITPGVFPDQASEEQMSNIPASAEGPPSLAIAPNIMQDPNDPAYYG